MPVGFCSTTQCFALHAGGCSYVLQVGPTGHLLHRHWGGQIADFSLPPEGSRHGDWGWLPSQSGPGLADAPLVSLNYLRLEFPTGWGDFRTPAVEVIHADGPRCLDLRYLRHRIVAGKPDLPGLPGSYAQTPFDAETLIITLRDALGAVEIDLFYTAFANLSVIARRAVIRNTGAHGIQLISAASASVDLPANQRDVITDSGAWLREFGVVRREVTPGVTSVGSARGISSAEHHPFILLAERNTDEAHGRVHGMILLWSGNHTQLVERDAHGVDRLQSRMSDFTWHLPAGEQFSTPEALLITTGNGLGGFSRVSHEMLRSRIVRGPWRDRPRPVIVNNWEAFGFDFDTDRLVALASRGQSLGCELFVLDDGWFGKRNDDKSGLGDWTVNLKKLPGGLPSLCQRIRDLGLMMGLWFEPEMISPDSDLYRAHPDWCLAVPGRPRPESRNQLVLDMGRPEIRSAILEQLFAILDSCPIDYLKLDMNRPLDVQWSAALPADRQGETAVRYTLGVYAMLEALRQRYPRLLMEGCASGGARFDAGMLAWCPQMWVSDNTDACHRLAIQRGASLVFPLACQVALVNAGNDHRVIPLATRCAVAATGASGFICDVNRLSDADCDVARTEIARYQGWRELISRGNLHRLVDDPEICAWMVLSQDRFTALMTIVNRPSVPNRTQSNIRLAGLDPAIPYKVVDVSPGKGSGIVGVFHGNTLMEIGLRPSAFGDWQTTRFWLERHT